MTLVELLILLLVAGLAGALGQAISGWTTGGFLTAIAVGFVGALLGTWLARGLGLPELFMLDIGGVAFPVVWAIIGAALFVAVISLLARPRTTTVIERRVV